MNYPTVKLRVAYFFILLLAFFLVPAQSWAQTITLQSSSQTITPGQTFSFDVLTSDSTNLFGAGFDLTFDPALFSFINATDGGFLSRSGTNEISLMTAVSPSGNLIFGVTRIGAASGGISGSGILAKLNFQSTGTNGSGTFSFSKNNVCILSGGACDYSTPGSWSNTTLTVGSQQLSDTTPPTTTASPAGGTYTSTQQITLSSSEAAVIYYTLDGSVPTAGSSVYTAPISITASKTLRYFAKDTAGNSEVSKAQTYSITTPAPSTPSDTTPPSTPRDVGATAVSSSQVNIGWTPSTDAVGVSRYTVHRNGTLIATVTSTQYTDLGLSASTRYTYIIYALDTAGNTSAASTGSSATTNPTPAVITPVVVTSPTTGATAPTAPSPIVSPVQQIPAQQSTPTTTLVTTTTPVIKLVQPTNASPTTISFVTKRHLILGTRGEDVKKLQELLFSKSYLKETPTGYYGKATLSAVQKFQTANNIASAGAPGYGEVGVKTRTVINKLLSSSGGSIATSQDPAFIAKLQEQIAILQKQLLILLEALAKKRAAEVKL